MGLSHGHAEYKILEKIQIYILTRAELLFTLCSEITCSTICILAFLKTTEIFFLKLCLIFGGPSYMKFPKLYSNFTVWSLLEKT